MTSNDATSNKKPVTKEKLRSIMEAASALTALGDEESDGSRPSSPANNDTPAAEVPTSAPAVDVKKDDDNAAEEKEEEKDTSTTPKRYLPDHKKPDAAPTFPEKMMTLMQYADKQEGEDFCVAWLDDGMSFVIRNPDAFTRQVVPKFFKPTKFSSFTRKLYRWGFRQVNRGIGPDDPIIFGNEHFQRDNASLMTKMRSITAAGTRKAEQQQNQQQHHHHRSSIAMITGTHGIGVGGLGGKRLLDEDVVDEGSHKRLLFSQLMQQQKANLISQNTSLYGAMGSNLVMHHPTANGGMMSLSNVIRAQQRPPQMMDTTTTTMPGCMPGAAGQSCQASMMMPDGVMNPAAHNNSNNNNSMMKPFDNNNPANTMKTFDAFQPTPLHSMQHHNTIAAAAHNPNLQVVPGGAAAMNQYMPQQGQLQTAAHAAAAQHNSASQQQFPPAQSTADIVNAAIAALRYAN